ncbi:MAG: TGS domain-containing protein [Candidatus Saccharimonadales bacterium]
MDPNKLINLYNPNSETSEYMRDLLVKVSRDRLPEFLEKQLQLLRNSPTAERASLGLSLFSPLANRLNLQVFKKEIEDLSFKELHPDEYELAVKMLRSNQADTNKHLMKFIKDVEIKLELNGIDFIDISGRTKQPYSLYKKLRKAGTIGDVYDLMAVRVLMPSEKDCYRVLNCINSSFDVNLDRYKDYIKRPKDNGYQSLHAAALIDKSIIEVQIRTPKMHQHAEHGSAAHWHYDDHKTSKNYRRGLVAKYIRSSKKYVYVFSPSGDVYRLSDGATALDFAFAIHTGLGLRTKSVKINNSIATLDTKLADADMVEVVTGKEIAPKRDWLRIVKTKKAKQRINTWIKQEERDRYILIGKQQLQDVFNGKIPDNIDDVLDYHGMKKLEELFVSVGGGHISPESVKNHLDTSGTPKFIKGSATVKSTKKVPKVLISGMDGLAYRLGNCCNPAPPTPVVGYITQGLGITIHKQGCSEVFSDTDRLVDCSWL